MSARPRHARTGCCVPFCRRTSTLFRDEWLCGEHWRLIPRSLRRAWSRAQRQVNRAWEAAPNAQRWRMYNRTERLWRRLKREAIGRAGELPL